MANPFKQLTARALLALAFAGFSGAAFAGPGYHVTVDTSSLSGSGYLDLTFTALAGAAPASASLSHFTGNLAASAPLLQGSAAGSVASSVTFDNSQTFNEFLQAITFGGLFGFDITFDVAASGNIGTDFGVALANAGLTDYAAGTNGNLVTIGLLPGVADSVTATAGFATAAAAVPEPASAALVAGGLLLLSLRGKRRGR
jgi:hypothetical protein